MYKTHIYDDGFAENLLAKCITNSYFGSSSYYSALGQSQGTKNRYVLTGIHTDNILID